MSPRRWLAGLLADVRAVSVLLATTGEAESYFGVTLEVAEDLESAVAEPGAA